MLLGEGFFLKKSFIIAAITASLLGFGLHFLYDFLPGCLSSLISPVNESVWEHLKLLFWPTMLAAFFLAGRSENPHRLWASFFVPLLLMPLFLTGIYYLLLTGFGVSALWIDIGLYFLTMLLGFLLAWLLYNKAQPEKLGAVLLFPLLIYGACLILFSFAAPSLEIFTPEGGAAAKIQKFFLNFLCF